MAIAWLTYQNATFLSFAKPRALRNLTRPFALPSPTLNLLRLPPISSCSGMNLLLRIFNLSWTLHSFPSIWKTSSIIPIHKMIKPLNTPAAFRLISLTSCVSKLFERIILTRLPFFLESNSILTPRQASFRSERSTLDQILFLSQSILDGYNKSRPGSRTILSTIDFSKTFDSARHPALFHILVSAGLPHCFVRWTQSFLSKGHL